MSDRQIGSYSQVDVQTGSAIERDTEGRGREGGTEGGRKGRREGGRGRGRDGGRDRERERERERWIEKTGIFNYLRTKVEIDKWACIYMYIHMYVRTCICVCVCMYV